MGTETACKPDVIVADDASGLPPLITSGVYQLSADESLAAAAQTPGRIPTSYSSPRWGPVRR